MRHKFFQTSKNYTQLGLAVLGICVSVAVLKQPSKTIAAPNPVSPVSSVVKRINATGLGQQGREFYAAGRFNDAVEVWQLAAKAFQAKDNTLGYAQALNYLAMSHQQLGSYSEAKEAIASSLKLLQNQGSSKERLKLLAQALNIQGQLQLAQGQSSQAVTTWQRAHATYTQVSDETGIIGSLLNQAQALQASGLYRRAVLTLNSVNQTLQKQPDSPLKAARLHSLGNALRVVGDLDQSRRMLQQSLALAQKLKSPEDIAAALFSLGNTARSQQDTKAALVFYQQAATASTTQSTRIQAQLNQLSLLIDTDQLNAAQAISPQIQSQISTFPSSRAAVYAQINFAQSLVKQGRKTALQQASALSAGSQRKTTAPGRVRNQTAPPYLRTSAQLLATAGQQAKSLGDPRAYAYALGSLGGLYEQTQQWSEAKDLTQQALLLAQGINAPDIAYRFSWQLGRLSKAQGDVKGAIANYTEAVDNLQSLRNDLVTTNPDVQFSFREEVEPVYRQLVDLLLQSEKGSQPSQKNLAQARAVIESLQLAELDNFFRAACLEGKPVQLDSVIDKEDPTAAVVYPIILEDRLEVILKLPGQPLRQYKSAVTQAEVERILQALRINLGKPYTFIEVQSLSIQVYDWLLRPAEADIAKSKIKTLVFVLDGSMRNIPMAALYDGQKYLVENYAVALTPGLQLLPPLPLERKRLNTLTAGLSVARPGFPALTNVALELRQIKSQIPSTTVLLNQQFTSIALQEKINARPFPVVHLATHGQFSSQLDQTFILAWDKRIKVSELAYMLQSRELRQDSAIELLVLSACETASGDKRAALGLAGVAMRAGARSTVASLWALDDESSARLMSKFYRELADTPVNKAEALRLAQTALLQDYQYGHPYYWAPYVLIGNWF